MEPGNPNNTSPPPMENNQWREINCFCKRVSVKTASYMIGIVESMAIAAGIIFFFAHGGCSLVGLLGTMLWTLAVLFLFLGLKQETPKYLLMNMFMQILQLIVFLVLLGISIYWIATGQNKGDQDTILLGSLFLSASFLGIIIEIWFFEIILKCYRYFRHKARNQISIIAGQQQGQLVFVQGLPVVGLYTAPPPQYNSSQPAVIQAYNVAHLAPLPTYEEVTKSQ